MPIFRESRFRARCERCHTTFAVGRGGVCARCRAVLCDAHLHGSIVRKLVRAITGAQSVCVRCTSPPEPGHAPGSRASERPG